MPAISAPTRETKTLHFQVKATGITVNAQGQEVGKIEAYGAMYGNIDDGNDRIISGACKRTIQNSKARAKSRNKDYLLPMIWNHDIDHFLPIGGWYEIDPDNAEGLFGKADVLLTTQTGREYYELAKARMIDTFSIIYDIPAGGARYDKSGVRELTEIRLFSIDPVVFPMNDETRLVGVKSVVKNKTNMSSKAEPEPKQRKTLLEHYNKEMAEDLLEDWQDVYVCSLTGAIFDALTGDQPEQDIAAALDAFKELIMGKFVPQAMECDLPGYLEQNTYTSTPGDYLLQYGSESKPNYGYMSRRTPLQEKAGASISKTNQGHINDHVAGLHDIATQATKAMKMAMQQMKAVHSAADNFADTMGAEQPDDDAPDDPEEKQLALALADLKALRL